MKRTHSSLIAVIVITAFGLMTPVAYAKDRDNNPPGPRGGQGTNWENPAGPTGGPGASPDNGVHRNRQTQEEWLEKHPNVKERLDDNNDGKLDKVERQQGRQEIKDRLDANDDGKIGKVERKAAREKIKQAKIRHANGDGSQPAPVPAADTSAQQ